jgi:hypothetical protein
MILRVRAIQNPKSSTNYGLAVIDPPFPEEPLPRTSDDAPGICRRFACRGLETLSVRIIFCRGPQRLAWSEVVYLV